VSSPSGRRERQRGCAVRRAGPRWRTRGSTRGRFTVPRDPSSSSGPTTPAPPAGRVFSPLDRELRLTRRPWTEKAEKGMARLGALIPSYRMAAATYTELVGLSVAAATVEEVVVVAGRRLQEIEATDAAASVALPTPE